VELPQQRRGSWVIAAGQVEHRGIGVVAQRLAQDLELEADTGTVEPAGRQRHQPLAPLGAMCQ
jgi:hypothetical protein